MTGLNEWRCDMNQLTTAFLTAAIIALAAAFSFAADPVGHDELARFRWKNRVLLVFAPSPESPAYRSLAEDLSRRRTEVVERDLVVFTLIRGGESRMGEEPLGPPRAESLRGRFEVKGDEFRVVLIGKDGMVKVNSDAVTLEELFAVIDAMPMRQREMEQQRRGTSPP